MILDNNLIQIASHDTMQLLLNKKWSLIDLEFLLKVNNADAAEPVVPLFFPLYFLDRPKMWFFMDIVADVLLFVVYNLCLRDMVQDSTNIGVSRSLISNFNYLLFFCFILGLITTEVRI